MGWGCAGSGEFWPRSTVPLASPDSLQQTTDTTMTTAGEMSRTAAMFSFQVQGRACLLTRLRGALCLQGLTASAGADRARVLGNRPAMVP